MMEWLTKTVNWLTEDPARMALVVGLIGTLSAPLVSYLTYQSIDDIEQVFLTKKQQIIVKLSTVCTVIFLLSICFLIPAVIEWNDISKKGLAYAMLIAIGVRILLALVCGFLHWICRKKTKRENVYNEKLEFAKYICDAIIGIGIIQIIYEQHNIFCAGIVSIAVSAVIAFFAIAPLGFLAEKESRVYILLGGISYYIYYKEDEGFICGNHPKRKQATELALIGTEDIKAGKLKILIKEKETKKSTKTATAADNKQRKK